MSGQFYKNSPNQEDETTNKSSFLCNFYVFYFQTVFFLDKLLLANDEEHLFNILNEKIVWNNNDNKSSSSINKKKQFSFSLADIEQACNKFFSIINQSQERFLKNTSEYSDFLAKNKQTPHFPMEIENPNENKSNNNENNNIKEPYSMTIEKNDEKSNNDNELLCEDEVKI